MTRVFVSTGPEILSSRDGDEQSPIWREELSAFVEQGSRRIEVLEDVEEGDDAHRGTNRESFRRSQSAVKIPGSGLRQVEEIGVDSKPAPGEFFEHEAVAAADFDRDAAARLWRKFRDDLGQDFAPRLEPEMTRSDGCKVRVCVLGESAGHATASPLRRAAAAGAVRRARGPRKPKAASGTLPRQVETERSWAKAARIHPGDPRFEPRL